jgi:hypothetical protein
MRAEKVGGKLLHLFAADGVQRAIDAVSGVIKQAVQTIVGQGNHLIGGAFNALRRVQIQQNAGKAQPCIRATSSGLRQAASTRKPWRFKSSALSDQFRWNILY